MKVLAASALAFALVLNSFASPAFAEKGKGNGGHAPEQEAKPHKPHPDNREQGTHTRGPERAGEVRGKQHKAEEGDPATGPEHEEVGRIGICHLTGNGSYIFIRVSENARGHLEHHADDILDVAGPEACPETVAEVD